MAKTDQPGLLEKHAEKIALAVAAIVLIAVLALWVVKSPHVTGEIGRGSDEVQPADMDARLEEAAKQAVDAIESRKPIEAPLGDPARDLTERVKNPFADQQFVPFTEGAPPRTLEDGPIGGKEISSLPAIPALTDARVWIGHELIQRAVGGMGMGMPSEDTTVAHVTAVLEYEAMIKAWKEALDGTGTPLDIKFVRVVAERQKRMPDGSWGPPEEIRGLQVSATGGGRPDVPAYDGTNLMEVRIALDVLGGAGVQESVIQPMYYPVYWPEARIFAGWMHHLPRTRVSNMEAAMVWASQQQPMPYMADDTAAAASATMGPRGGRGAAGPAGGMGGPGAGMGGMGMGGMGMGGMGGMGTGSAYGGGEAYGDTGGGARGGRTPRQPRSTGNAARETAIRSMENATKALDDGETLMAEGRLREAGSKFRGAERLLRGAEASAPDLPGVGPQLQRAKGLLARLNMPQVTRLPMLGHMCQGGYVQIWVHDDTVESGATYQYRLRLDVYNPLFFAVTPTDKIEDAAPATVSTRSEWADPVAVPNRNEFYLAGGPDSAGHVKVSVFRETYGQVLMQKIVAGIGDPIGATETRPYVDPGTNRPAMNDIDVDFSTGYVIVDFEYDKKIAPRGINNATVQVTLLAPDGSLITRTLVDDRKAGRYRELVKASKEAQDRLDEGMGGPGT